MSKLLIYLLDNLSQAIREINIMKPKDYQELLTEIKKIPDLPENYEIFKLDEINRKIIIDDNEKFKLIENIILIGPTNRIDVGSSLFEINYNKLSESKQEVLDEKYNCLLCSMAIKNEKPYFCYKCQKIYHEKCLKDWENKRKSQNLKLTCPNCRNELPLEEWEKKLDYEENRNTEANLMDINNKYKINNYMNIIKDKKINNLEDNNIKLKDLIKKYEIYMKETFKIFKNIIDEIHLIHSLIKLKNSNKLNNLVNNYILNFDHFRN